ncbi:tetratricopeptide repeat protein [Rugamonas apoptosis]|uniref:Tetratricopeptide repeat protein n=1 Tax=Rugamonas apoptosis TaxID=2758570 RepID=A0A7W2IKG9_9BURK|nr:tetratricopeptide repeat protein [Rugamonas apoptosis]MBA5687529.1 tetratricopeptide repeat protein [Rugamonas apoptosis]
MSLINKMLQDLDARGGKPGVALGQQELRPVAMPRKKLLPALLGAGAVGVVALAAGSWYGWHYFTKNTVKPRPAPVMVVVPQAQVQTQVVQVASVAAASAPASAPTAGDGAATGDGAAAATVPAPVPVPVPAAASGAMPANATPPAPVIAAAAPTKAVLSDDPGSDAARRTRKHKRKQTSEAMASAKSERSEEAKRIQTALADNTATERRADRAKARAKPTAKEEGAQAAGGVSRDLGPAQLAENRYRRALQDLQEGRTSEALVELRRAVELAPRHDAARQTLVTLLIENHRTDEAAQQLQQALALDDHQPDMAMLLARLQLESGGPALDTLLRTLPYAGDNAEYQGFVAGVLQRAQRHGEAVEHYQAALKLAPQKGVWWMGLGISLQAGKRLPEARIAYTRARAASGMTPELLAFVDRKLEALGR